MRPVVSATATTFDGVTGASSGELRKRDHLAALDAPGTARKRPKLLAFQGTEEDVVAPPGARHEAPAHGAFRVTERPRTSSMS